MQLPLWHQHCAVQIAVEAASLRVLGTGRVSRERCLPWLMKHPQSRRALARSVCVYVGPTWLLELVLSSDPVAAEVKNLAHRAPLPGALVPFVGRAHLGLGCIQGRHR